MMFNKIAVDGVKALKNASKFPIKAFKEARKGKEKQIPLLIAISVIEHNNPGWLSSVLMFKKNFEPASLCSLIYNNQFNLNNTLTCFTC